MFPINGILLKGVLIPNWLNNLLTSCSLIKLDFLLLHTAYLSKNIIFPLLVFETFGFFLFTFFLLFKQYDSIAL